MKTMKARYILFLFVLLIGLTINDSQAQAPPPVDHGSTGDEAPAGGGAPISGGIVYLVVLGAAYGTRKWFLISNQEEAF